MVKVTKFVGLDVHKDSISVAWCEGGPIQPPMSMGKIPHDVGRLLAKLAPLGKPADVHVAYEAGPTGYGLYRKLRELGYPCIVVAPNKTPRKPGPRRSMKAIRWIWSGRSTKTARCSGCRPGRSPRCHPISMNSIPCCRDRTMCSRSATSAR